MKRVVEGGAKRPIVRRRSFTREFKRLVIKESLGGPHGIAALLTKHQG